MQEIKFQAFWEYLKGEYPRCCKIECENKDTAFHLLFQISKEYKGEMVEIISNDNEVEMIISGLSN